MFPYAYGVEKVQVVTAFVAIVILLWSLWDVMRDTSALRSAGINGTRLMLAMNNVRAEIAKLLIVLAMCFAGIVSVLLPPPTSLDESDPRIQVLIEQARQIDSRILQERDQQHMAITANRLVSMFIVFILLIDSLLSRRVRMTFVRRADDARGVRGRQGEQGRRGEPGERGARGEPGPPAGATATVPAGAGGVVKNGLAKLSQETASKAQTSATAAQDAAASAQGAASVAQDMARQELETEQKTEPPTTGDV